MIIKFDFGDDYIQYISYSTKVGRKINCIQEDFLMWIFDEEKNKKYWAYENGEKYCPNYDANAIVNWFNDVKFNKGIAKAKLIRNPQLRVKKTLYFYMHSIFKKLIILFGINIIYTNVCES